MAGASSERQENGLIKAINDAVKANKNNAVTVVFENLTLSGVTKAEKYGGRQAGGSEPYTDVVLYRGTKTLNLSCKGESAPSLAGGGLKGLELAVPGIAKKFMMKAFEHLKTKKKLRIGDKVPDVYGKISKQDKLKIVVGNKAMGGPIDYMYIGPMDVTKQYDSAKNRLKISGSMYEAESYANSHDLYFRLRARREDQRFDPTAKDSMGTPKIYGKSPSKGDSAGRIVVTDDTPASAVMVNL
jgi:hypothetical protein